MLTPHAEAGPRVLVPRSGVSAPHSGGAEPETGRLARRPGPAGFGAPTGQAGGEVTRARAGRRALVVAAAPVTGWSWLERG